jgi:hypothetical protein
MTNSHKNEMSGCDTIVGKSHRRESPFAMSKILIKRILTNLKKENTTNLALVKELHKIKSLKICIIYFF